MFIWLGYQGRVSLVVCRFILYRTLMTTHLPQPSLHTRRNTLIEVVGVFQIICDVHLPFQPMSLHCLLPNRQRLLT